MKKLFIIAALGLSLVSCKKSSSGGSASIQATIGGTTTTFNVGATAAKNGVAGNYLLVIAGATASGKTAGTLNLVISSFNPAIATTYSENSDSTNASIAYVPNLSDTTTVYSNVGRVPSNPLTITITSITSASVQGTFQGNLYINGDSTQTKKAVTNGTFNVNF